jgi:gluconate kinase
MFRTLYPQWNIRRYSQGKRLNETQSRVDMLEHVNKFIAEIHRNVRTHQEDFTT